MNRFRLSLILLIISFLFLPACVLGTEEQLLIPEIDYHYFKLDNGLQVYVIEDSSVPLVELGIFYKVGAIDEPPGLTGISHFLEHAMFLGTESLGKGQLDQLVDLAGGYTNAATSFDFTYYYMEVPSSLLELAIALEADRMVNLKLDPVEIEREREVILQERRQGLENVVFNAGLEQLQAAAFADTSLEHQVIGWAEDIQRITVEDLASYYRTYYSPNNAILVVVGDATVDQVKDLTEKYFGDFEPQEIDRPRFKVAPQGQGRVYELQCHTNIPIALLLYHTPAGDDPDLLSIGVILNILVNSEGSRVKQELQKNQQLIIETAGVPRELRVPSYTLIYLVPTSMETLPLALQAFDTEIERLIEEGITEEEFQIVKKHVMRSMIFAQKDPRNMAINIAYSALSFDQPNLLSQQLASLSELTVEDIQAAAAKYFTEDNRIIGLLVPIN
ncbi:MAG: insulinase family protein [Firmicutes bacterium]|nr:insulinase family protein [Bacillota bacterium]